MSEANGLIISAHDDDVLLTTVEAAKFLRVSVRTLEKFRCEGSVGPRYIKVGKRVLYRRGELERYLQNSEYGSTSEYSVSKAAAKYQPTPKNGRCADCYFFRAPNLCHQVKGDISPQGWCSFFVK